MKITADELYVLLNIAKRIEQNHAISASDIRCIVKDIEDRDYLNLSKYQEDAVWGVMKHLNKKENRDKTHFKDDVMNLIRLELEE